MKAGTSSLRAALSGHPQVAMPLREPRFFTSRFPKGMEWYLGQFAGFSKDVLWGEKSANYYASLVAPERIKAYSPNAKVIFTLRDPVRRAVSQYYHARLRSGDDARTLEEDLDSRAYEWNYFMSYVYRSQYQKHLALFADHFPGDRTLVLILEEVIQQPDHWLSVAQDFLGVERLPVVQWPHSNQTRPNLIESSPVSPATVERLREVLAPTTPYIEEYLGRALPAWRST